MKGKLFLLIFVFGLVSVSLPPLVAPLSATPVNPAPPPPGGGGGGWYPPPPPPVIPDATPIVLLDDASAIRLVSRAFFTLQTMLESGWFNTLLMVFALIGFVVLIISMWLSARFNMTAIIAYFLFTLFILFAFTFKGGKKIVIFRRYYLESQVLGTIQVPYGLWLMVGLPSEIMSSISEDVDKNMAYWSGFDYKGLGSNLSAIYSALMSRVPLPAGYRETVEDFTNQCLFEPLAKGMININDPNGVNKNIINNIRLTYYKKPDNGGRTSIVVHPDSNTTFTCGDYWNMIVSPNFDVDTALYNYYERNGYIIHKYSGSIPEMNAVFYADYFCINPSDSTTCFQIDKYMNMGYGSYTPNERYIKGMLAVTVSGVVDQLIKRSKMENVMAEGTSNQGFIAKGFGNIGEAIARYLLFWTARAIIKGAPLLQSFVIAILVLMYPVIVAIMLIPGFGGLRFAWGYFTSFLWVLSWGVVFILIGHFAALRLDTHQVLGTLANLASNYIVVPTSYIKYLDTQVDIATIVQALLVLSTPALTYPIFMRGGAGLVSLVGAGMVGQMATRAGTSVTKAAGVTATDEMGS